MKYYLIAGEASGDLHGSRLIAALRKEDSQASFRGIGGDMMAREGMELVEHYRDLAYMGFISVLLHLPTILRGMKRCKQDILAYRPDKIILIDYPGFNLKMAHFAKRHTSASVCYYILPKAWAWKERRTEDIRRDVDLPLSILPFEKKFYEEKHGIPIHYVGNPTADEVTEATRQQTPPRPSGADSRPVIALLPGSRRQEVKDNLPRMIEAAEPFRQDYRLVVAAAPGLDDTFYEEQLKKPITNGCQPTIELVRDQTFQLLRHSTAALVTSGTATLETALLNVPQVVCYRIKAGRLASFLRHLFLKVPHISLVNLIAGEGIVPELVAEQMTAANVRRHLSSILPGGDARAKQLEGYKRMAQILGGPGAHERAAKTITSK